MSLTWCFRLSVAKLPHKELSAQTSRAYQTHQRRGRHPKCLILGSIPRYRNARKRLELKAQSRACVSDPGIVSSEIGVGHMIDKTRHAEPWRQLITELDALTEQRRRAELLAVGRGAVGEAILECATQASVEKDTVTPPEQVLDQRDPPGQTEIAGVGVARSVEGPAEMGARRTDDAEEIRRSEQHLEIDIRPRFDVAIENRDIMGEDTEFELVDIWVCAIAMVGPVAA